MKKVYLFITMLILSFCVSGQQNKIFLKSNPAIGTVDNPALSAAQIITMNPSAIDTIYWLDPDGNGGNEPFRAYCDMTTDGGGWTLVLLNNKSVSTCPSPTWNQVVDSINYNGTLSADITSFDLFLGVKYWNALGSEMRLDMGAGPASLSHRAFYDFSLDGSNNYTLSMSNESVTIHTEGTASPGMYTYHSGRPLSTCDADHDGSGSGNCATNYNCAAWWYGSCWSGSFWGGGGTVSQDAPYWEASVAEYFEYGSIWIRGTWTPELSSLTINSVTDADCRGATVHGTITDPGSPNPTAYGVCWNTTGTPDTTDSHTNEGSASAPGDFTSTLPDILPSTTYYLRAYATNFAGISYSPEVSVATAADDTGPTLYCNDTTIYFDADGSYTIDTSHIFSGIYDYCGVDTLYVVNGNLTCDGYSLYPRTVSIYAKDVSGNMDSCQATVTMVDTIRPVIECLSDQVRDAGVSNTYLVSGEEFAPALAEDNCYFTLTNNLNGSNSLAGLFLPTGSNRIQWTITDRFGNADSCSFIVEVNEYVSGMVTTNAEKPAIYPNPAAETVTIEYYRTTGTCKIEVLNIIGLVLYSTETKEKKTTIDLSGFPAGVYHIRISANDQETSTRLIKR